MEKFRTIRRRALALMIDGILLLPISAVGLIFSDLDPLVLYISNVLTALAGAFYTILMHARFGQTLGKMAVRVKVLDENEGPITFGQAVIRSLPQLVPILIMIGFQNPRFLSGGGSAFETFLAEYVIGGLDIALVLWTIADIIICLSSEKHRALHDFIAGTVVIRTDG